MLELKFKIVFVGIRTEADFLDNDLLGLGLHLLLLLLLIVFKLGVINNFADRRIGTGRNFHQIQILSPAIANACGVS